MKGPHFPGSLLKKLLLVGILDRRKKMDKLKRAELRLDKEVANANIRKHISGRTVSS